MIYTPLTNRALQIAYEAHHGQKDKCGIPYIFHPYHLAEQMDNEYAVCVALLHDVMEDTDVSREALAAEFPEEIMEALDLLTHHPDVPYLEYVEKIKPNTLAKTVKLADLTHNSDSTRLPLDGADVQRRLEEKYRKAFEILKQRKFSYMSHVIAAVSTGNQVSAIGILRLTGDNCAYIAGSVFTCNGSFPLWEAPNRKLVLGTLRDKQGRVIDQCMAVYTRGPHSYTGEDTVEFHCHGSPAVLAAGLEALYAAGARPAKRGEFTMRAFMNGQLDLTQAEAVIDLIEADSADAAANAAGQVGGSLQRKLTPIYNSLTDICSHFHAVLDYPDEDIADFGLENYQDSLKEGVKTLDRLLSTYGQGRILKDGVSAAIVGKPNVGKSSLLNALAGYDRVIVTSIPGTTRDTVEEVVKVAGVKLRLIDTAGIRETADTVEAIGVERSRKAVESADMVIFVCDGSKPLTDEDRAIIDICCDRENAIALINKTDLGQMVVPSDLPFMNVVEVCAATGDGLTQLGDVVETLFGGETPCDGSILTNARQADALRRAHVALEQSLKGLRLGQTPDMVLIDIEEAMEAMGEVTGATVREDITARIFERFCVGK